MPGNEGDNWIVTYTGNKICPLNMRVEDICLADIAHALAMKCRYTGHCRRFYSVGQHSALMSIYDLPGPEAWRLLHDASEAYLPDVASPIKHNFPRIVAAEEHILRCVAHRFGLVEYATVKDLVKVADIDMMRWEGSLLMPHVEGAAWVKDSPTHELPDYMSYWTPEYTEAIFLKRAEECQIFD